MSAEELVSIITGLSIAIAKDKSIDELNELSAILTQLGDTLATIATRRDICSQKDSDNSKNEKE